MRYKQIIRSIILLVLLSGCFYANAQNLELSGKVLDDKSDNPINGASIQLIENERWTITDKEGYFSLNSISAGQYTLVVQCLGYITQTKDILLQENTNIEIKLSANSYKIEEITVLETKSKSLSTTIHIGNNSIEHTQASSLNDLLQLLPGSNVLNPDFSEPKIVSIREIGTDDNTASGTSIIIDNIELSNDANFQTLNTNQLSTFNYSGLEDRTSIDYQSTIGNGIDLRHISTERIEYLDVISGIPSVKYGNLTSGALVIKTKAGYTPWESKIKTDPSLKLASINKGFNTSNGGSYNFGVDYLNYYKDLRTKLQNYKRITANVSYSNVIFKNSPLSYNIKLKGFHTLVNKKQDEEILLENEKYESTYKGFQYSLYGIWQINSRLFTNIQYTLSGEISDQKDYQKSYRNAQVDKISTSMLEGESEGIYLPSNSLTSHTLHGKPISFFTQVYAGKTQKLTDNFKLKYTVGLEYRKKHNKGNGSQYDISNPPYVTNNNLALRPRSFKDKKAIQSYTLFAEENLIIPIRDKNLEIQAGVRFNNFQPQSLSKSDLGWYTEPRFNIKYEIINNDKKSISNLTLRGGYGLLFKSPSLVYLYPDKAYFDLVSLDYYTDNEDTQLAYFTTYIVNSQNKKIKPSQSKKYEIGIDVNIGKISAYLTAFKEEYTNGFGLTNEFLFLDYNKYDASLVPENTKPIIENLPVSLSNYTVSYKKPVNNKASSKTGIEYTINLPKFNALYTKLSINGAWLKTKRIINTVPYADLPNDYFGDHDEYIGIYPSGKSKTSERLNTNFRFVTHSTKLKLILTTNINLIWFESFKNEFYQAYPDYLLNKDNEVIVFSEEMINSPEFREFYKQNTPSFYRKTKLPILPLCNFKLSKELGNRAKLSFYANNFINHRPVYQNQDTGYFIRRNPALYFGAEFKVNL